MKACKCVLTEPKCGSAIVTMCRVPHHWLWRKCWHRKKHPYHSSPTQQPWLGTMWPKIKTPPWRTPFWYCGKGPASRDDGFEQPLTGRHPALLRWTAAWLESLCSVPLDLFWRWLSLTVILCFNKRNLGEIILTTFGMHLRCFQAMTDVLVHISIASSLFVEARLNEKCHLLFLWHVRGLLSELLSCSSD